jgi:dihydroflavonol-4-reductase
MMRVLVTGATGFVGINAIHRLLDAEHEPVALVRRTSPTERLPDGTDTAWGDITDADSIHEAVSDVDAIFHFAATHSMYKGTIEDRNFRDWERTKAVNVDGTENLVVAAADHNIDSFAFTSTYRAHPDVLEDESVDYVRSKILAAQLFEEHDVSFDYTILYPTTIMGPYDYRMNKLEHFWWVRANRVLTPPLFSPGGRNLVHVDDVIDGALLALEGQPARHQFVTGENFTGKGKHEAIAEAMDADCRIISIPYWVLKFAIAPTIELLRRRGMTHLRGEDFLVRSDSAVPAEHENITPGKSRPARQIFEDMYEWYTEVGLL